MKIVDSDAFLDMPASAQNLYFHLSMRADDEGFINNPKKIQRIVGASEDDMRLLIAKSFVIAFETGVVVIKHWKIHNYIRGDRIKTTSYRDEAARLSTKENGAYTLDPVESVPAIEDASDCQETARQKAYRESELPYSFDYKIRQAFYGKNCPICGFCMKRECSDGIESNNRIPTIQHNIPVSKGGRHELGNISVVCRECNVSIKDNETGVLNAHEVAEVWEAMINDGQVSVKCQSNVGIGKDSIGKDSIGKDSIGKDSMIYTSVSETEEIPEEEPETEVSDAQRYDYEWYKATYNAICGSLTGARFITDERKRLIREFEKRYGRETFEELCRKAEASSFLSGKKNPGGWRANFNFLLRKDKIPAILEGQYDDFEQRKMQTDRWN